MTLTLDNVEMTGEGEALLAALEELNESEIRIGVDAGATYPNGMSVDKVAAFNELGTSTTPARPFLSQAFNFHQSEIAQALGEGAMAVLDGADAQEIMENIGEQVAEMVRKEIQSGSFVPNSPETVKKKGSAQPLVDSGLLISSIGYEIAGKGEE